MDNRIKTTLRTVALCDIGVMALVQVIDIKHDTMIAEPFRYDGSSVTFGDIASMPHAELAWTVAAALVHVALGDTATGEGDAAAVVTRMLEESPAHPTGMFRKPNTSPGLRTGGDGDHRADVMRALGMLLGDERIARTSLIAEAGRLAGVEPVAVPVFEAPPRGAWPTGPEGVGAALAVALRPTSPTQAHDDYLHLGQFDFPHHEIVKAAVLEAMLKRLKATGVAPWKDVMAIFGKPASEQAEDIYASGPLIAL